jgi:hypothetical protein
MIEQLLMVAGPSGSGKSFFMSAIAAGRLASDLRFQLPAEARSWPHADGKSFLACGPATHTRSGALKRQPGLVLHYDIMRPYSYGYGSYEADPALAIMKTSRQIVVVSLLPPVERLVRQFLARETTILERKSKRILRSLRHRLTGRDPTLLKEAQVRLLEHYQTPGWIEDYYRRWLTYLETLALEHPDVRAIALDGIATAAIPSPGRANPD